MITWKVVFTLASKEDVRSAREGLRESNMQLAERFFEDVKSTLDKIAKNPKHYAIVYNNVRQCRLEIFPHVISYRIVDDTVQVLAVIHGRRDPEIWKGRSGH